jgi:hypothetical protein
MMVAFLRLKNALKVFNNASNDEFRKLSSALWSSYLLEETH